MSFLAELLDLTRSRIATARAALPIDELRARARSAPPVRLFRAALQGPAVALIGEIKRATPSAGDIAPDLDAASIARAYGRGGAAALSVLTEPRYFKGRLEDLADARAAGLPVLRKDFILDPYQVVEARAWGADAVLLIVRTLGDELHDLIDLTSELGMDALVEVFDEADVDRALSAGAGLIGINHRDLITFEVDAARTEKLAPLIGDAATIVALSGVSRRAEVEDLGAAGADAVLVGTSLVTAADPARKVRELVGG